MPLATFLLASEANQDKAQFRFAHRGASCAFQRFFSKLSFAGKMQRCARICNAQIKACIQVELKSKMTLKQKYTFVPRICDARITVCTHAMGFSNALQTFHCLKEYFNWKICSLRNNLRCPKQLIPFMRDQTLISSSLIS